MAGDWIKIQIDLSTKPEVISMAERLGLDEDLIVGKLVKLWGWADRQSRNGHAFVTTLFVDRHVNVTGFAQAMIDVGWLECPTNTTIAFPNFERHNGNAAKQRVTAAERQRLSRLRHGNVTKMSRSKRDKPVTREEKRREEINTSKSHSLTRKPRAPDERSNHPAIKAIRDVTRKFPDKAIWDEIITRVGSDPDSALLTECYSSWIKHGFNPTNYAWLFEWYLSGGPQDYGKRQQSASDRNFEARIVSERLLTKPRDS